MSDQRAPKIINARLADHLRAKHGLEELDRSATDDTLRILHEHDHHPLFARLGLGAKHDLEDLSTDGATPEDRG